VWLLRILRRGRAEQEDRGYEAVRQTSQRGKGTGAGPITAESQQQLCRTKNLDGGDGDAKMERGGARGAVSVRGPLQQRTGWSLYDFA